MTEKEVKCPVCGERFELEDGLEVEDETYCPGCFGGLRIISINPHRVEELIESFDDSDREENSEEDYE